MKLTDRDKRLIDIGKKEYSLKLQSWLIRKMDNSRHKNGVEILTDLSHWIREQ